MEKHCELILDNYHLSESCFHSLIKLLKRDPVTLHEYASNFKKEEPEEIIEEPPEKCKSTETVHYLLHHPVIRSDKSTLSVHMMHLLKGMTPL